VILKNSCLVHDIGNPPFGHFGETVVQNYFSEFFDKNIVKNLEEKFSQEDKTSGKILLNLTDNQKQDFLLFDGNAQGLRVLTKLQILNDIYGLNLTYATLGSYIKYPNYGSVDDDVIAKHKIGVFDSEIDFFNKIVENCGLKIDSEIVRHPLCYLMEAADSICYLTMDIEDGYSKSLFDLNYLYEKLKNIPSIKDDLKIIYEDNDDVFKNDTTKVVNFRIKIIQQLVLLAVENFNKNLDKIEKGEYNEELILDDENELAISLKKICGDKIFKFREINSLEITGHSVIKGLLDYYIDFIFHKDKKYRNRAIPLISESILKIAYEENKLFGDNAKFDNLSDYYKLRIIVDFISGMTDQFALNHYQKISGQKIK
jgi:dGTPase